MTAGGGGAGTTRTAAAPANTTARRGPRHRAPDEDGLLMTTMVSLRDVTKVFPGKEDPSERSTA